MGPSPVISPVQIWSADSIKAFLLDSVDDSCGSDMADVDVEDCRLKCEPPSAPLDEGRYVYQAPPATRPETAATDHRRQRMGVEATVFSFRVDEETDRLPNA